MKGNYPFAVLHTLKNDGPKAAMKYAISLSKEKMSDDEAKEYVRACMVTNGQPQLLDLFEG